jgi:cytochrome c oxidase cbb3-type subunit III
MNETQDSRFKETGHVYDGIQEYDNPLPSWWYWLFVLTVIFAPFYLGFFHAGATGRTIAEQFQTANSENMRKQYAEIGELNDDEATLLTYMQKDQWMKVGSSMFRTHCVSCHGPDGGGSVGPNLCDESFKNIKQITDIVKVINNGVAGGAMPAWGNRLGHKNDIVLVSAYVASLRGSQPKKPKAADGTPIPPWPPAPPIKEEAKPKDAKKDTAK